MTLYDTLTLLWIAVYQAVEVHISPDQSLLQLEMGFPTMFENTDRSCTLFKDTQTQY